MGFHFRKTVSVGPFRFNLSGSGVGVSIGVPGFRVGSGPRGNYVHVGGAGVYYRQSLPAVRPTPRPRHAPLLTAGTPVDSAAATEIADSSSASLLDEIRRKRRMLSQTPFVVMAAVIALLFAANARWSGAAFVALVIAGIIAIVAARYRDRVRKTVVIVYDLEPPVAEAFGRFTEWASAVGASRNIWYIDSERGVHDRKYHAGASSLVDRRPTTLRNAAPPFVKTNVPVVSVATGLQTLYFFPDRLLVYDATGVGAVAYRSLTVTATQQPFIEDGAAPADATVTGYTWKYVNRSGGPDRRFSNNPRLAICRYDELALTTRSGLHEVLQISRSGVAEGFAASLRHLAQTTS